MLIQVTPELQRYVEANIIPRYDGFDKAHQRDHVLMVIQQSMELAEKLGVNADMAYAIAAYHDLGLSGPRAVHHLTSGKILLADVRLRRWFTTDQLNVMKEAVEDHRASASHAPRSIYGKIVAEADRDLDPDTVFRRTIQFGLSNYPEKDREEQFDRFLKHVREKYSEHGYIRLWMPGSPNEEKLKQIRKHIANPSELKEIFNRLYDEEITNANN